MSRTERLLESAASAAPPPGAGDGRRRWRRTSAFAAHALSRHRDPAGPGRRHRGRTRPGLRAAARLHPAPADVLDRRARGVDPRRAWAGRQTDDSRLSQAAGNALGKIAAVLPAELRREIDRGGLYVTGAGPPPCRSTLRYLRDAIRKEIQLRIDYRDDAGRATERVIWPFVIGFFEQRKVVAAWCELRKDYRNFRIDRIAHPAATGERAPRRRACIAQGMARSAGCADGRAARQCGAGKLNSR